MTTKISVLATVGLIATASLIVGLQQLYVSENKTPTAATGQASIVQPIGEIAGEAIATPVSTNSEVTAQPLPLVNATKETTPAAAIQLCAQHQGSLIWACSGRGVSYYAVTANQLTVDAPMDVYASDGSFIASCGGYMVFVSAEAKTENDRLCTQYHLGDCQDITSLCVVQ